jgi:hypothetical protein
VRKREGYESHDTRGTVIKERRFNRLYGQRSKEKKNKKIKKLGRGNLPKRRGTETNLADHRSRRKNGELSARCMGGAYETYREKERQISPKSKDSRYALAETDKQKKVRLINN